MKLSEIKDGEKFKCGHSEYKRMCQHPENDKLVISKGANFTFNLNADADVRPVFTYRDNSNG